MARINGNELANTLNGTSAADAIFGYGGNDTLFGNGGADILFSGIGNDTLYGNGGADILHGETGSDLLDGGAGIDRLDGGAGTDTARYAIAESMRVSLGWVVDVLSDGPDYEVLYSERLSSIENFIAGSGDDTLYGGYDGSGVANALWGGAGNDHIVGSAGGDTLDGGTGSDTLFGGEEWERAGNLHPLVRDTARYDWAVSSVTATLALFEIVVAGNGTDTVYDIENVWAGAGADTLYGDAGSNELRGGAGADVLSGGAGDDTLWGQSGTDVLDGGDGSDTAMFSEKTTPVRVDLASGLVCYVGQPWPNETVASIENAVGGSGNDTLLGDGGGNVLRGGPGADRIDGRGGLDTVSYSGESGALLIDLVAQRAGAIGGTVRDTLVSIENARGGAGNDSLVGTAGANVLDGGNGADTLKGGAGNDSLVLSLGTDRLDGGAGTNTLVLDQPYERYANGYQSYFNDGFFSDWTFNGPSDATVEIRLGVGAHATFLYGGTGSSTLTGIANVRTGVGNDYVYGSDGANVISVGHGANFVDGAGGNDVIYGSNLEPNDTPYQSWFTDQRDGEEVALGGSGNDRIVGVSRAYGEEGNDTLVAGWFDDQHMTGGPGADRFQFTDDYREQYGASDDQHGTVDDFNAAAGDRIVIDRVDDSAPGPVFVGAVDWKQFLEIGEYGVVDGNRLVYAAAETTPIGGGVWVIGPEIELAGFTGTLTPSDVIFI